MEDFDEEIKVIKDSKIKARYSDDRDDLLTRLNNKHTPAFNDDCNELCLQQYFTPSKYKIDLPEPLIYASNIHGDDPYKTLISLKKDFQIKLKNIRGRYLSMSKKKHCVNYSKMYGYYSQIQTLLKNDPDKYFYSNYNWYYTGGNLSSCKISDTDALVFQTVNNLKLTASRVQIQNSDLDLKWTHIVNHNTPNIYQIDSLRDSTSIFCCTRQKNKIIFYNISESHLDKYAFKRLKTITSTVPLAGINLNQLNPEKYATSDVGQVIKLWNISRNIPDRQIVIPNNFDSFNGNNTVQIKYDQDHILACMNKTNFYLYDLRENKFSISFDVTSTGKKLVNFSNFCLPNNNSCYISTGSDIFNFDYRKMSVLHRWNHGFTTPPILSAVLNESNGLFCFSSDKSNEKLILEQNQFQPANLPSLQATIDSLFLNNPRLNIPVSLKNTLNLSTTGLTFLSNNNDEYFILTSNSFGNIFTYRISENQQNKNTKFLGLIENNCHSNSTALTQTDKIILKDTQLDCIDPIYDCKKANVRMKKCCNSLRKSVLHYTSKLSDIWYETERNTLEDIEEILPEVNVSNWLSKIQC